MELNPYLSTVRLLLKPLVFKKSTQLRQCRMIFIFHVWPITSSLALTGLFHTRPYAFCKEEKHIHWPSIHVDGWMDGWPMDVLSDNSFIFSRQNYFCLNKKEQRRRTQLNFSESSLVQPDLSLCLFIIFIIFYFLHNFFCKSSVK